MCALPSSKTTVDLLQGAASKNVWILNLLMQLCQICSGYCTRRKRWVVWRPPSNILTKEHRYGVCKLLNRRKTGVNGFFSWSRDRCSKCFLKIYWQIVVPTKLWRRLSCGLLCVINCENAINSRRTKIIFWWKVYYFPHFPLPYANLRKAVYTEMQKCLVKFVLVLPYVHT